MADPTTPAAQASTTADGTTTTAAATTTTTAPAAAATTTTEPAKADAAAATTPATTTEPANKEGAPPAQPKVPEKYEFVVPQGSEVFFEASDLDAYAQIAKANELTQEEAQAMIEAEAANRQALVVAFGEQTKADPVYGGAKLVETQQLAKRVIDRVRPAGHARAEAFNKLLTKSGYGNHIEVVAFLADLGRLMSEDTAAGGSASTGKRLTEEILYGGTAQK
jgi:hypothetical protein